MSKAFHLPQHDEFLLTSHCQCGSIQGKIRTLVIAIVACAVGAVVAGVVAYCVASPVAAIISIVRPLPHMRSHHGSPHLRIFKLLLPR